MTGAKTGHSKNTETVAIQITSMSFQLFIADYVGPVGQVSKKTIQNGLHLPLLKAQLSEALFLFPLKTTIYNVCLNCFYC